MNTLSIKEIAFGSKDYRKAVVIRDEVLRVPLDLSFSQEELKEDSDDIHIAGFSNKTMIGTLIILTIIIMLHLHIIFLILDIMMYC